MARMAQSPLNDDWRFLRVGHRIRFIRLPTEFGALASDTVLAPEEVRLYKKLISRGRPACVSEIDKDGRPWICVRFRQSNGRLDIHFLAVDDNSWVRIRPRRK